MVINSTIPLGLLIIAGSGVACGGVVLMTFYTLIYMCSGCFPEWSGQAVPAIDTLCSYLIFNKLHIILFRQFF